LGVPPVGLHFAQYRKHRTHPTRYRDSGCQRHRHPGSSCPPSLPRGGDLPLGGAAATCPPPGARCSPRRASRVGAPTAPSAWPSPPAPPLAAAPQLAAREDAKVVLS